MSHFCAKIEEMRRLISLPLLLVFVVGCSSKTSVVGEWENIQSGHVNGKTTYIFKDDGTYTEKSDIKVDSSDGHFVSEYSGTYTFEDDVLITNSTTGKMDSFNPDGGVKDHYDYSPSTFKQKAAWFHPKKVQFVPDASYGIPGPYLNYEKK